MKNQAGGLVRQIFNGARTRTIHRNPIVWVCLVILVIVLGEVSLVALVSVTYRAFMLGFLAASTLACFGWLTFAIARSYRRSMGRLGEEATAQAVASARRRRKGWRLVNGIRLRGHGAIDHVLIGPGGVYVIESRWASKDCEIGPATIVGIYGREPVSRARDGAQRIERMLRDGSDRFEVTVQPMVVVWGPGGLALDAGWTTVDGVLVCEGRREEQWLDQLDGSELNQSIVERVTEALTSLLTRQVDQLVATPSR
jgi:hypothetical protein